jgi:hypothetical protein
MLVKSLVSIPNTTAVFGGDWAWEGCCNNLGTGLPLRPRLGASANNLSCLLLQFLDSVTKHVSISLIVVLIGSTR